MLLAHAGFIVVLVAIAGWGSGGDMLEDLRNRTLVCGALVVGWAWLLVAFSKKTVSESPNSGPAAGGPR